MLDFKKMELTSEKELRPYLAMSENRLCDITLGGTVMWREAFNTKYAVYDGALYMKMSLYDGRTAFTYPIGKPFGETYKNLSEYCEKENEHLVFCTVSKEEKDEILKFFPNANVNFERDFSDYIYLKENLSTFAGKKYAGQRNHIHRFMKEHDNWNFEIIDKNNIEEIKSFFDGYNAQNDKTSFTAVAERKGVYDVIDNLETYGFDGEALRVDGKIIGFFLCEALYDTLFVHIEKCERDINGAYQMLVMEEASKYCVGDLKYINREDDSGDEGLRTSKLSYHPFYIAEKYTVTVF